jgi:hypothetical protein
MGGDGGASIPTTGTGGATLPTTGTGGATLSTSGTGGATLPTTGTGGATLPTSGTGGATLPTTGTGGATLPTTGTGGATLPTTGTGGATFATGTGGATFQTTGTGGTSYATTATGGATSGTGGSGHGFLGDCEYPSCIWNLIRDCHPDGACTRDDSASSAPSTVYKLCCDGGFNEIATLDQTSSTLHGTLTATRNGSKCYSVAVRAATGTGGTVLARYVWTTPDGQMPAGGTLTEDGSLVITCTNGETFTMAADCSPDGVSNNPPPSSGTCP